VNPRPLVKWCGGKTRLVPQIMEMVPPRFGRYHEPFLGGGALFFAVRPKNAFLGDVNRKLIETYCTVRDDVEGVIRFLQFYRYERTVYNMTRARNFEAGPPTQRAAEFIYCNKCGFNGLHRVNSKGQFNVPFGRYPKDHNPCDADNLRAASLALRDATIKCHPYNVACEDMQPGDFAYFDPPYEPLSATSSFTKFTADGFTSEDQRRLAAVALELKKRGVFVVLSNSAAPLIRELYQSPHWTIREIQASRSINSKGDGRAKITELLIY